MINYWLHHSVGTTDSKSTLLPLSCCCMHRFPTSSSLWFQTATMVTWRKGMCVYKASLSTEVGTGVFLLIQITYNPARSQGRFTHVGVFK